MASREVTYAVRNLELTRHVRLGDGREYTHRSSQATFEDVAWFVQEHLGSRLSTNELWKALPNLPFTQIHVALSFLEDRGCVVRVGKWLSATSELLYEDAMEAFSHLVEAGT